MAVRDTYRIPAIKPINCCGIVHIGANTTIDFCVHCLNCGKETDWYHSQEEAIEAWNKIKSQEANDEHNADA